VHDHYLYVFGGMPTGCVDELSSAVRMDLRERSEWQALPDMSVKRTMAGVCVYQGYLVLLGGASHVGATQEVIRLHEWYHPSEKKWSKKADLPHPLLYITAAVNYGTIEVVGNDGNGNWYVCSYDPPTDSWTSATCILTKMWQPGVAFCDNAFYIAGGISGGPTLHSLQRLDIRDEKRKLTQLAKMNVARRYFQTVASNGQLFAAAGADERSECLTSVEVYDIAQNRWSLAPQLIVARHEASLAATVSQLPSMEVTF